MLRLYKFSIILFIFFICFANLSATTWYIKPDSTGQAPTIQAGIDSAAVGDTVLLANGTFTGDGNRNIDFLGKAIAVISQSGNPDSCVIDCGGSGYHRGFYFHSGEDSSSLLEGFTITNGSSSPGDIWNGGAILCTNSSPTIRSCVFSYNNIMNSGGAICGSPAKIIDCIFKNNHADEGGAICGSPAKIIDCIFENNSSPGWAGAIYGSPAMIMRCTFMNTGGSSVVNGSPTLISDCIFFKNNSFECGVIKGSPSTIINTIFSNNSGGGMKCEGGAPTLTNCSFVGNWGDNEGGILCEGGAPTLTNCSFVGNEVMGGEGGGMLIRGSATLILNDCVFANNRAMDNGGGLNISDASATLTNCKFSGNYGMNGGAIYINASQTRISNCYFSNNLSNQRGGGIYSQSSRSKFTNCNFSRNRCYSDGGGLFLDASNDTLLNCAFIQNYGSGVPGLAGLGASSWNNSNSIFINCTFNGNVNPDSRESAASIFIDNSCASIYKSIISFTFQGQAINCSNGGAAILSCSNLYGNAAGDWVGCIAGMDSINGNFSSDPLFCDIDNDNFTLDINSPCLPWNNSCGDLIGAFGYGCGMTVPHHFEITYPDNGEFDPGNRSNLIDEWVTVRVSAMDSMGAIENGYIGTIILSTKGEENTAEVEWGISAGNGIFIDGGPGVDTAIYRFDLADSGVVDLKVRDDCQDFIDPEVADSADVSITDNDSEEYIAFTQPINISGTGKTSVFFGKSIASFSTSSPKPKSLVQADFQPGKKSPITDHTLTVVPYKDTSLLGITPPPNFEMLYEDLALEAPYPYCNGYNMSMTDFPPDSLPKNFLIHQAYHDSILTEPDEVNIQVHHWNGLNWDILPGTINAVKNYITIDCKNLSQLSPLFITQPLEENVFSACISIEPSTLNIRDRRGWLYGYIEFEGGIDVQEIDINTVTINPLTIDVGEDSLTLAEVAAADLSHFIIGDHNVNGIPDLWVRFAKEPIVSMFTGADLSEEFMIRGFMNDGYSFFKGYTTIETINEPIAVVLYLKPEALNLKSQGKWVTAYIEMPEFYYPEEIEIGDLCITKVGELELASPVYAKKKPTAIGDFNGNGVSDLMVKFDRQALQEQLTGLAGIQEITVEGTLEDGTAIRGTDFIKVINKALERFAVTRMKITWNEVTPAGLPHIDSYEVQGLANLLKRISVEDLTWEVHFLLSLSGNDMVYEETVKLDEYLDGFIFAYTDEELSAANFVERLVLFNPEKWHEGMEIPEGLLDIGGRKILRDIEAGNMALDELSYVYIRGELNLPEECEEKMSPREARVVLEAFTEDNGSLANRVLIGEGDFQCYELAGNNVWEFRGRKESAEEIETQTIGKFSIDELVRDISAVFKDSRIEVSWTVTDAAFVFDHNVLRAKVPVGEFHKLATPEIIRDGLSYIFSDTDYEPGTIYRYRVELSDKEGREYLLFETDDITTPTVPFTLFQNHPNPFNPITTISYYLPVECMVTLEIYDSSGRLISNLLKMENKPRGLHSVKWRGLDYHGRTVSSGIYFYRLTAGKETISKKMVLLK